MKKTKFIAGVLATVVPLASFAGCSKEKAKPVTVEVSNNTSISSTLDAVSEHTQKDEFLENLVYDGHTFEQYAKGYEEGRKQGDKQRCVINQKQMATGLLNYFLASYYGEEKIKNAKVSIDAYVNSGFDYDGVEYTVTITYPTIKKEVVPGGIVVEKEVDASESFKATGVLHRLIEIADADYSGWTNEDFENRKVFSDEYNETFSNNVNDYLLSNDIDEAMITLITCVMAEMDEGKNSDEVGIYLDANQVASYNEFVKQISNS